MNEQQTETCANCNGTGRVESLIEETTYKCGRCGGHKVIPVSGSFWFYKPTSNNYHLSQQIACVTEEPDGRWQIALWRPDGPSSHMLEPRKSVFGELRAFRPSNVAPRLLDHWATTEMWAHGLKQLEWVAISNLIFNKCTENVREILHEAIIANKSLDNLLVVARALKNEHAPDIDVW